MPDSYQKAINNLFEQYGNDSKKKRFSDRLTVMLE